MIAILADDLTSALDGAGPFAGTGRQVRVVLGTGAFAQRSDADVLAVDLDTRFVAASEAERRFAAAGQAAAGSTLLFKTVDSTLRGNVAAEIAGALRGSGLRHAVVAPAFPAAGRTTVRGVQMVDGIPVADTAFAHDVRTPVRSSRVVDHLPSGASIEVADAEADTDLDALVQSKRSAADVLWVGSPGLASALARAVARGGARPDGSGSERRAQRVLVVVGSLHEASSQQVVALDRAGVICVSVDGTSPAEIDHATTTLVGAAAKGDLVCLHSSRRRAADPAAAPEIAAALGRIASGAGAAFDAMIMTGGDTARRVIDALGTDTLTLSGELERGFPLGAVTIDGRVMTIATKAGGFGSPDSLVSAVRRLRAGEVKA